MALASASVMIPSAKAPSTYVLRLVTDWLALSAAVWAALAALLASVMASCAVANCSSVTRADISSAMTDNSASYLVYIAPVSESTYSLVASNFIYSSVCKIRVSSFITASANRSLNNDTPYINISPVNPILKSPVPSHLPAFDSLTYSSDGSRVKESYNSCPAKPTVKTPRLMTL